MRILEIILWVGVLAGWCVIVGYGIKIMEAILDTFLDRWFDREPVEHNENPWPDYKE